MPDIDFQKIELNLIPKKGEQPVVFYASQYETARPFIAVLKWGDTEFAPGVDYRAEIDIRKNDDNLVIITDDVSIDNNEVSVVLPVQAVTCIGKNLGQVKIYSADDHLIAALNFILEVQADPLAGGVTSETAIDNLTQQIEDIAEEVIGEDYYNKTETDALLADKADKSELSNYYKKYEVNNFLNAKVDKTTLQEDYYDADYISTQFARKSFVENYVDATATASGNPCTFNTAKYHTLIPALTANIVCGGGGGTPSVPVPLVPHSEINLDVNGNIFTSTFGQSINGGVYNKSGSLTIKPINKVTLTGNENWSGSVLGSTTSVFSIYAFKNDVANEDNQICSHLVFNPDAYKADNTPNSFVQGLSGNFFIEISNDIATTVEGFKTWLATQYANGTPVEYIYNSTASETVIDVDAISPYAENGTNTITSDGNGDVNVSYKDTIQHYIDERL